MVLKEELSAPEYFEEFKREARRVIDASQKTKSADREATRKQLAKLDSEIDNLIQGVREFGMSASLREALSKAEAEREQLQARAAMDDRQIERAVTMIPRMAETFQRLVADIEAMPDVPYFKPLEKKVTSQGKRKTVRGCCGIRVDMSSDAETAEDLL